MKKYLIKTAEKYTKDGVEKTMWHTVGGLAMFDKDGTLRIPAIGLIAKVYPVEEKQEVAVPKAEVEEDINPADIPF